MEIETLPVKSLAQARHLKRRKPDGAVAPPGLSNGFAGPQAAKSSVYGKSYGVATQA
jgi:hypothetical protein